ncbi:hypothetical protein QJS04_geneDACA015145 [Acorus gramineus]|uniref:Glucosidase 2 subunit beta n=1 Tax=Acorus gramineus TaxID=55184 RepID=A0AAV9BVP3_ACOGR|nr:hypothetical protein QJS04_geneDACA015145 [Acorus gramineus]
MKPHHDFLTLSIACLLFVSLARSTASIPSKDSLGISPKDEAYYKSSVIECRDGSKKFTRDQLNDGFCDCPDGTDEPGTSACPEGRFYCQNVGHVPLTIFSSRVNDGICDCCDGTDEYDSQVKCPNTCWEAGKEARDKLKKKIATFKEGASIRKGTVERAKQEITKDEAELERLKSEKKILKVLVQTLKERKEQIEKAEEQERLEREKEEKRLKEAESKTKSEKKEPEGASHDGVEEVHDKEDNSMDKHAAADGHSVEEAEHDYTDPEDVQRTAEDQVNSVVTSGADGGAVDHEALSIPAEEVKESSEEVEGLSKEELGRLVASRWTGENAGTQADEVDVVKEVDDAAKELKHDSDPDNPQNADEDDDGYVSESEGSHSYASDGDRDGHKSDYEDEAEENDMEDEYRQDDHNERHDVYHPDPDDVTGFSDEIDSSNPSWLDKIQKTVRNFIQSFKFFRTPVDKSEAAQIRKEYDDSSAKLSKIESRISDLTEKLKHEFGKDKEFYSFYGQCFEYKENKYVYKVCPFKQASQVEGYSTTQLGRWEKFEESYRVMQFLHGDKCWNGPDRSLKVRLRCGLKNELSEVDEPSRCEYIAFLLTPAVCLEERVEELQRKLDLLNQEIPKNHDEL